MAQALLFIVSGAVVASIGWLLAWRRMRSMERFQRAALDEAEFAIRELRRENSRLKRGWRKVRGDNGR